MGGRTFILGKPSFEIYEESLKKIDKINKTFTMNKNIQNNLLKINSIYTH